MSKTLVTILTTLPIGAILGWLANRLFAPTFDELGVRLKGWIIALVSRDEYSIYVAYSNLYKLISELHKQGHNYFSAQKPYLYNHEINLEVKSKTGAQLRNIASMWIRQAHISSYGESDIFFAGMELLLSSLTKDSVQEMFIKHKENDQAVLWPFLELVEKQRSALLSEEVAEYLHNKQAEWKNKWEKK